MTIWPRRTQPATTETHSATRGTHPGTVDGNDKGWCEICQEYRVEFGRKICPSCADDAAKEAGE